MKKIEKQEWIYLYYISKSICDTDVYILENTTFFCNEASFVGMKKSWCLIQHITIRNERTNKCMYRNQFVFL